MNENEEDEENKEENMMRSPILNTEQFSTIVNKDEAEDLFEEYQNFHPLTPKKL